MSKRRSAPEGVTGTGRVPPFVPHFGHCGTVSGRPPAAAYEIEAGHLERLAERVLRKGDGVRARLIGQHARAFAATARRLRWQDG